MRGLALTLALALAACGGSSATPPPRTSPTASERGAEGATAGVNAPPETDGGTTGGETADGGPTGAREARQRASQLFQEASAAYARGDLQAAARGFEEAYALYPNPELAFNAGRVRERMASVEEAVRYYNLVLASNPPEAQRLDLTQRIASLRDYERRRQEDLAQPPPDQSALSREGAAWFQRGMALFRRGRYESALQAFEASRQFAPSPDQTPPELSFNLGVTHERLNHRRDAIDAFRDYLSRRPDAPDRAGIERRIRAMEIQ